MSATLQSFDSIDRRASRAGALLLGLATLREADCDLLLDVEGREARRFAMDSVGVTLTGITVDGEIVIHFDGLQDWGEGTCGGDAEGPGISFDAQGRKGYICPARPVPELLGNLAAKIDRFLQDWDPDEHFHVSDLDGPVRGKDDTAGLEGEGEFADRVLRVRDERFPVSNIVWFDGETDGDGNTHWHLVDSNNRYRRICFGDLSR